MNRTLDAAWLREGPLPKLFAALDRDGEEARAVGGAVRNALLGLPVTEIDVATTAVPDEVIRRAVAAGLRTVPTGIEHGTVTVLVESVPFEVTTLRRDVETFGRRAKVAFGRDWTADAERRDFTMNALSVGADGTLHDPVGGMSDLRARRVRFIGDAATRIAEDHLRILRFFRFQASYGEGAPDADGLAACTAGRAGLAAISRERIRMEMLKLMVAPRAAQTLAAMQEHGLLVELLGGVPLVAGVARMAALEAELGLSPDPIRRLAALAIVVEEDAERLSQRWRLTRVETSRLRVVAVQWLGVDPSDGHAERALLYRLGADDGRAVAMLAWARAAVAVDDVAWKARVALSSTTLPSCPFAAADFMTLGLSGPSLGKALSIAEEAWIDADFPTDEPTLERIRADATVEAKRLAPAVDKS